MLGKLTITNSDFKVTMCIQHIDMYSKWVITTILDTMAVIMLCSLGRLLGHANALLGTTGRLLVLLVQQVAIVLLVQMILVLLHVSSVALVITQILVHRIATFAQLEGILTLLAHLRVRTVQLVATVSTLE